MQALHNDSRPLNRFPKLLASLCCATALIGSNAVLAAGAFTVSSPDFKAGQKLDDKFVFSGFGCTGGNVSPALLWKNAPAGTKSFAVTSYDPDAPTGSGFWHWVMFNIPATTTELAQNAGQPDGKNLPQGAVQSRTDFGSPGYGGPCPPVGHGLHHYHFTVYALKVDKIDLPVDASAAMVGFMVNMNLIKKATVVGVYGRNK